MAVTAKFYVKSITTYGHQPHPGGPIADLQQKDILLLVVTGDSEENKSWSKWTPSGELKLSITNPDAFNQFREGQAVLLTLEPQP